MTAQILSSELLNLIQESKRKHPDLRNAAEKSLNDLKTLPNTSELQLAAALEVQLKVLQALPSLLQNYGSSLKGQLLISAFQVCFLLHGSKTAVVSNTAAASIQQLLAFTFEKLSTEDGISSSDQPSEAVSIHDGSVPVLSAASDAFYLMNDVCLLTEGIESKMLQGASLAPSFGLELVETVLVAHIDTITKHVEQNHILRVRLMPLIIKILSEKASFNITVRAVRLLRLLVRNVLPVMTAEVEMAMSLISHLLDPTTSVLWKRVLCLELLKDICEDSALVRSIYAHYDEQEGSKSLIGNYLAAMVRLAAEKPAVIGLGQQSSRAEGQQAYSTEQIAIDLGGFSGAVGISASEVNLDQSGISVHWSAVRVPCIDQIDKAEPPALPVTYLYSLVLTCINSIFDGLAKFLLPFTVPMDIKAKRKQKPNRQRQSRSTADGDGKPSGDTDDTQPSTQPSQQERCLSINPLTLKDHELYGEIRTSALIVEHCWPALLATSSTFFDAALDSDYYHALVRSFQKFTQIAGLLDFSTPRDAFLTTLAKHAVPPATAPTAKTPVLEASNDRGTDDEGRDGSGRDSSTSLDDTPEPHRYHNPSLAPVTTRNLLCLRALLNLGIALGPLLQTSWTIILETLHQVDVALFSSEWQHVKGRWQIPQRLEDRTSSTAGELSAELGAVETAVSRLYESTGDLLDYAFLQVLGCLCSLVYRVSGLLSHVTDPSTATIPQCPTPGVTTPRHHRIGSMSGHSMSGPQATKDSMLLLDRFGRMAQSNVARFSMSQPSESGFSIIVDLFIDHLSAPAVAADIRISAARKLNELISHLMILTNSQSQQQDDVISRCLRALSATVSPLWKASNTASSLNCSLEIHALELETLASILEQRGETLRFGWDIVFSVVMSVFENTGGPVIGDTTRSLGIAAFNPRSPKLVRSSFASLQLICSDFLRTLPDRCFVILLNNLYYFCSQDQDLNISLTSTTLFRDISNFLLHQELNMQQAVIEGEANQCTTEAKLIDLVASSDGNLSRDRLQAESWVVCFRLILLDLLLALEGPCIHPSDVTSKNNSGWIETSVLTVSRASTMFAHSLRAFSGHVAIAEVWNQLLGRFTNLLQAQSLTISGAIFRSLTEILHEIEIAPGARAISLESAWVLWRDGNPSVYDLPSIADNHDSLAVYLQYMQQLHGMLEGGFDVDQTETVMRNLKACITQSTPVIYGSDMDEMTMVQKLVLESMDLISTSSSEILIRLTEEMGSLVTLAFENNEGSTQKGKTFVALSKAAMNALADLVKQHSIKPGSPITRLLDSCLHSLKVPIQLKYKWKTEGKGIATWKKATSTALSVLDAEILRRCEGSRQGMQSMWTAIVEVNDGIAAADTDRCDSRADIGSDQAFDIESFSQMQSIITPILGLSTIPDKIRRKYVESLFQHSIIHEPHPDDLARPDQELLDGLRSQHVGRVQDLPPKQRSKMAYVLLDQLFDLVALHDSSSERVKLAQAAAPYLILRVGLVLKAYTCDQPLRGKMPQPLSQKREMHYVLRRSVELESEPKAFPKTIGVQSENKKHLFLMFGLVTKALKVAWRDEEMGARLREVLEAVGADFGI
ncbi:MAG: hypothetical protein Q9181_003291 [Wetmoreana brouardii]